MSSPSQPVVRPLLASIAVALGVLVLAVLPAEYGFDPTGVGRALGLTSLAEPPSTAHRIEASAPVTARATYVLEPYEAMEYKLELNQGAGMVYAWTADGELEYDMHAQPANGPEDAAQSYSAGRARGQTGSHVAPFEGEHGWYWQNRSPAAITINLSATGFFANAVEYRDGRVTHLSVGETVAE